jgi:subtilisin family serine protease
MRLNNKVSLLPYIREDLHGLSPNDPQALGWELLKFDIPELWTKCEGEGVTVAVIDTGCDLYHDDIKNNLLQGNNFVSPGKDPMDVAGHGTHVSSTIAAKNNGVGMVGVAPKTKIVPVKALNDNGQGNLDHICEAIKWSADRGVDFITMSLGAPRSSTNLQKAIEYADSKGCVMFCAAGNSGPNTDIMYPAKYDHTIAIGAIDANLERTNFTCSGESLDFLAPGHDIMGCVPGNKYALMSGTSMSNPFVVGCASLLLSYNKKYNKYKLDTANNYIDLFKKTAFSLKNSSYRGVKKYEGYGIIDIKSLIL